MYTHKIATLAALGCLTTYGQSVAEVVNAVAHDDHPGDLRHRVGKRGVRVTVTSHRLVHVHLAVTVHVIVRVLRQVLSTCRPTQNYVACCRR